MFGNFVNKNARAALKEYGDFNGVGVEYEMLDPTGPPHSPQYTARVMIGESRYDTATAATKKDAKEYAADLALRALTQEPGAYHSVYPGALSQAGQPSLSSGLSSSLPYRRYPKRLNRKKQSKNNQLSAPPDKDPVMLINEYGQKMNTTVKFEDTPCSFPGMFESFVFVGSQKFGPMRSTTKKMARKLAAIVGLKELINWEPKQGLYDAKPNAAVPELSVEPSAEGDGMTLTKDPVMLLNEYCQRSQKKIVFEEVQEGGTDHNRVFSYRVIIDDRTFEQGSGASKSRAKKNAALFALKSLYDMPLFMPEKQASEAMSASDSHPVSMLNEYGQKHKQKIDFEDLGYTGPDHGRTYSFRVIAGERIFDMGYGASKKEAKREAAKIALSELLGLDLEIDKMNQPPAEEDPSNAAKGPPKNPGTKSKVSELYEYCQAYHLEQPEPKDVFPADRTSPSFHYVSYKIGDKEFSIGDGRSKKAAREAAATLTLDELMKKNEGSKYTPVGTTEADRLAALSWNCLSKISKNAPDSWRFAGYKVLATIIMQDNDAEPCIVSLGTGNKCISGDQLCLDGSIVFDSHAEVIARRGLIRFFLCQLDILFANSGEKSIFEQPKAKGTKMKLRDGVKFHLYISTAPCGDAAIFVAGNTSPTINGMSEPIFGNKQHGLLRTKVEKGEGTIPLDSNDGVQTIDGIRRGQRLRTASCSDKLMKWNVLGMQGALLSNVIEPVYLSWLVVGDLFDAGHLSRALSARVERDGENTFSTKLPAPYHVNHPTLHCGRIASHDSSRKVETKNKAKNVTLNWILEDESKVEVFDACLGCNPAVKSPPRLSKLSLLNTFKEVLSKSPDVTLETVLVASSYREAKNMAQEYTKVKSLLFKLMNEKGYGSWELMKKPVELDQFC
ncbi:double-stranded RNA-specific adenosine deaminase-like [Actinia tenebrosa]|uniref:Double-stranded RNA-specific adenosine deaminase-like n=1 Tax=Actinia tenebrosa TaxID=6105 RepID=A0A6P8GWM2_ACTTE|nr:double-stranded RNA-specific adenosine deaminase-like [Actinia tenebrosa]